MHRHIKILSLALAPLVLASCGGPKRSAAAEAHEAWVASLNDSVTATKAQIEDTERRIDALHDSVGHLMTDFAHVSNPREVEGYVIARSLKGQLPLTATGLAARITESEGFELLSALSGATYCRLRVSAGGQSAETAEVPHDQALNYRHAAYNTVAFSGAAADSVGRLIAEAAPGSVSVEFIAPGGRKAGSMRLGAERQQAVAQTWRLYHMQHTAEHLERSISLLNRKIALFRLRLEKSEETAGPSL